MEAIQAILSITAVVYIGESLWGAVNAVLEYIDHYQDKESSSLTDGLFGQKASTKKKAFDLALRHLPEQLRLF